MAIKTVEEFQSAAAKNPEVLAVHANVVDELAESIALGETSVDNAIMRTRGAVGGTRHVVNLSRPVIQRLLDGNKTPAKKTTDK